MRSHGRVFAACTLCVLLVSACQGELATDRPPLGAVPSPVVDCGDIESGACDPAVKAVRLVIAGRAPIAFISLGRGTFCTVPGLLFASTSCPRASFVGPNGGRFVGHAEVVFLNEAQHGYLNIEEVGSEPHYLADLVDYAVPPPSASPS